MSDGDFEPEGWSAFDDHGAYGEKGNAGCAVFFIVIAVAVIIGKISGEGRGAVVKRRRMQTNEIPSIDGDS